MLFPHLSKPEINKWVVIVGCQVSDGNDKY
jgi:hypothetical protein